MTLTLFTSSISSIRNMASFSPQHIIYSAKNVLDHKIVPHIDNQYTIYDWNGSIWDGSLNCGDLALYIQFLGYFQCRSLEMYLNKFRGKKLVFSVTNVLTFMDVRLDNICDIEEAYIYIGASNLQYIKSNRGIHITNRSGRI